MQYFLVLLAVGLGAFGYSFVKRRQRRARLLAAPLSDADRRLMFQQVPLTRKLPEPMQRALEGRINLFLDQVEFIGCNGLEVTPEMRLSIAAQACLLVVNSDAWYTHLNTVLLYPGAFKSLQAEQSGFVVTERETIRLGESWSRGPVVLSWAHARQGAENEVDGQNVVFHEFAHQFDDLSGHTNGVPVLGKGHRYADWERVFLKTYRTLVRNVQEGRKTVLDEYGATAHEEMFAVAVEMFFEQPSKLQEGEPEVYAQLVQLFKLDPKDWS